VRPGAMVGFWRMLAVVARVSRIVAGISVTRSRMIGTNQSHAAKSWPCLKVCMSGAKALKLAGWPLHARLPAKVPMSRGNGYRISFALIATATA
jgi:hypothetical protein